MISLQFKRFYAFDLALFITASIQQAPSKFNDNNKNVRNRLVRKVTICFQDYSEDLELGAATVRFGTILFLSVPIKREASAATIQAAAATQKAGR